MNRQKWMVLMAIVIGGCAQQAPEGTEQSARDHFDHEFNKWMSGQESEVSTMKSHIENLKLPIGYDIRSVVADEPHGLAIADHIKNDETKIDLSQWTAWKFNVAIEWESQAGTAVSKITTYTLTWNPYTKKWFVNERF